MPRRDGILLAVLGVFFLSQAGAQDIAVIKSHDIRPYDEALAGFVAACPNHAGDRLVEYNLYGSTRRKADILKRITAVRPQLVLAIGALAAQIAKEGLPDTLVVFFMVPNPRKYGLEGGNVVGISLDIPVEAQFVLYTSLVPALRTIGVIYDPVKTGTIVTEARVAAAKLGLRLRAAPVASEKAVPRALRSLLGSIDALWMVPDDTVVTSESFKFLLRQTFENNLPFLVVSSIFVEVGALASLAPNYTDVGRQGCQLVNQIISGRLQPEKVDIVSPEKVDLTINLKTAKTIGLRLSSQLIQAASKVYR